MRATGQRMAALRRPPGKLRPSGPEEHHVILSARRPPPPRRRLRRRGGRGVAVGALLRAFRPSPSSLVSRRSRLAAAARRGRRPGCGAGRPGAPLPRHGSRGGRGDRARAGSGGPSRGSGGGGGGRGGLRAGGSPGAGAPRSARPGPARPRRHERRWRRRRGLGAQSFRRLLCHLRAGHRDRAGAGRAVG